MLARLILAMAVVVGLGFVVLTLARAVEEGSGAPSWLRRVRLKHLAIALAALGALFLLSESPAGLLVFCGLIVLVLFAREWVREFYFLMDLRDDDLPGRFDKPLWALVLLGFAPVGLWLFRAYRRGRWPEIEAKPAPEPAADLL
jgi:hypothetical protein